MLRKHLASRKSILILILPYRNKTSLIMPQPNAAPAYHTSTSLGHDEAYMHNQRVTTVAKVPATGHDSSETRTQRDRVADQVIGVGAWVNHLSVDSAMALGRFCLELWGNSQPEGIRTSRRNESLPPMARWMLQDVAQEPYNNTLHIRASQISDVEVTRHRSDQK
jgi:hypothetical protein